MEGIKNHNNETLLQRHAVMRNADHVTAFHFYFLKISSKSFSCLLHAVKITKIKMNRIMFRLEVVWKKSCLLTEIFRIFAPHHLINMT